MLRGGRDPLYPRPSEPEYPRDEPYEPRFSAPAPERDSPERDSPDRDSEDARADSSAEDRGAIGLNFCHPPLLAPPPSRPEDPAEEPIEFPPLGSEPTFELPRASAAGCPSPG